MLDIDFTNLPAFHSAEEILVHPRSMVPPEQPNQLAGLEHYLAGSDSFNGTTVGSGDKITFSGFTANN